MSHSNEETAEMFAYYEARAAGYEDFYQGKGAAIPALAAEYEPDTNGVSALLSSFGRGDVIDLACGTGFWLQAYGGNSRSIALVDQSAEVLARCRQRARALGLERVATMIQGDLYDVPLRSAAYDACVIGFLISHLNDERIDALFQRVRTILRPRSELAVIDSVWSEARRPHCHRESFERRPLPDGREFKIRKKYYDRPELESLLVSNGFAAHSTYVGNVFIGIVADRAA